MTAHPPEIVELVKRLRELKATPVPWVAEGSIYEGMDACISDGKRSIAQVIDYKDAALIVAAVNALPTLLDALQEVKS